MATSFFSFVSGRVKEIIAAVAGGPGSANQIAALDANGRWTADMMPAGFGADTITLPAAETLAAGAFVTITAAGVRNASAAGIGTRAHGYVNVNVASGANAAVMFDDANTGITNAPIGDLWLSATTPGQVQNTSPTGAGVISQRVGVGITATLIHASIQEPVILAQ